MKKYIAELLGTFALAFVVILGVSAKIPIAVPIAAAATVGMIVYLIGPVSGAHVNPAITLALWSIKKINAKNALGYIIAQFIGAGLAMWIGRYFIAYSSPLIVANTFKILLAEAMGAFVLAYGVVATILKENNYAYSGLVIGGGLFLGILIASAGSNGVLNPAVAFGIGSFSFAYFLGPIVGAWFGAQSAKMLHK